MTKSQKSDKAKAKTRKGRTTVTVFPDWCKGCGLCAAFCPSKVFELDQSGKARVVREDECVNCGFCELHCPDFAIMVQPRVENGSNGGAMKNGTRKNGASKQATGK